MIAGTSARTDSLPGFAISGCSALFQMYKKGLVQGNDLVAVAFKTAAFSEVI